MCLGGWKIGSRKEGVLFVNKKNQKNFDNLDRVGGGLGAPDEGIVYLVSDNSKIRADGGDIHQPGDLIDFLAIESHFVPQRNSQSCGIWPARLAESECGILIRLVTIAQHLFVVTPVLCSGTIRPDFAIKVLDAQLRHVEADV